MPVKIRLQRRGRTKSPFYHIVIADARAPRDGRFIEKIGIYNPMTKPATIDLDRDLAFDWLMKGAQPTDTARAILRFKGVLYRKHLMKGVQKGALTEEQAMEKYQKWIDEKEAKIATRRQQTADEKSELLAKLSGKPPVIKEEKPADSTEHAPAADQPGSTSFADSVEQTTVESVTEEAAPVAEETPAPAEEAKVEEAPAPEVKAEEPTPAEADDLKKIEGIGPKIAEVLTAAGIATYAQLAEKSADDVKKVLADAEGNFASHDPTTWGQQAKMAADGKWDELKKWQDELDGGKEVKKEEDKPAE